MSTVRFDAPDADIILCSSLPHAIEFRVHRCILAAASPFFANMFSLPQPPVNPLLLDKCQPLPVVDLSESNSVVQRILEFVYPVTDPVIDTLDDLTVVLGAATKYDFISTIHTLSRLLVSPQFTESSPMRVFSIACMFDLEEEAKIASRHTLSLNILDAPLSKDLKYITAYEYRRLLDLHRERSRAALEVLQTSKPCTVDTIKCMQCSAVPFGGCAMPRWWNDFLTRACEELGQRPCTSVIFSMAFLSKSARAGCPRCAESVLNSYAFLEELKKKIDELPSTV